MNPVALTLNRPASLTRSPSVTTRFRNSQSDDSYVYQGELERSAKLEKQFRRRFKLLKAYLLLMRMIGKTGLTIYDIDEMTLCNAPYRKRYGVFTPKTAYQWHQEAVLPVIQPTLEMLRWHDKQKMPYAFLSYRKESLRTATLNNLALYGITRQKGLYLRGPEDDGVKAVDFKTRKRREIETELGIKIIASVGDQKADVTGSHKGLGLLFPNPFYTPRPRK